jgi:phosphoglycerol transferase MdoB-like AlkP superfamily enzyme
MKYVLVLYEVKEINLVIINSKFIFSYRLFIKLLHFFLVQFSLYTMSLLRIDGVFIYHLNIQGVLKKLTNSCRVQCFDRIRVIPCSLLLLCLFQKLTKINIQTAMETHVNLIFFK